MAEQDELVGPDEIATVVVNLGRRCTQVVQHQRLRGDPLGIEANPDGIGAKRGDDEPRRVERFIAPERNHRIGGSTEQ